MEGSICVGGTHTFSAEEEVSECGICFVELELADIDGEILECDSCVA